jgi:glycosyltransferase involved in cell wall biosynthesis
MSNISYRTDLSEKLELHPDVSVIVCTHNRAHSLARTLEALEHQTYPKDKFEIIVVDDGSVDETRQICEKMQNNLSFFSYHRHETNRGLSAARNTGIKTATADKLLFTDDDCIPASTWVEKLSAALSDGRHIVSGAVDTRLKPYAKLCHNISAFHGAMPSQKEGPRKLIAGANMGFSRRVLEELGGFRTAWQVGDDTEIMIRAGRARHEAYFTPNAVVMHDPDRTTLRSIMRYSAVHGSVSIRLRNRHKDFFKTPFIFRSSALVLLAAPLIALEVTGSIYLRNRTLARLWWTIPAVYATKLAWCWGAARGIRVTSNREHF